VGKLIFVLKTVVILGLCAAIFGPAGWFTYQLFIKPYDVPVEEQHVMPTPPPDPSLPDFEKALALKKAGKTVEARTALEAFLENYPYSTKIKEARQALGQLNSDIFFSSIPAPEKIQYVVRPGDALAKIERKLKTSREMLMRCNNLDDPTRLQIGQVLLVNQPDFSVTINRKEKTLTLLNHYRFFKEYTIVGWNVPPPKKGMEKVALNGVVGEKIAWRNGARVQFGSKEYTGSERWVEISVKGHTLYTEGGQKPTNGISFAPDDMEELSTLLVKNVPVTIQ
jgi:LysM repeat protein